MPCIDFVIESKVPATTRVKQLSAMFDVPLADVSRLEWHADIPLEKEAWNVGLIVGPSGCGKTQIARHMFGTAFHTSFTWENRPVIDDFDEGLSIGDISKACQAVGFNTIPAWMRPHSVLSNGEQ